MNGRYLVLSSVLVVLILVCLIASLFIFGSIKVHIAIDGAPVFDTDASPTTADATSTTLRKEILTVVSASAPVPVSASVPESAPSSAQGPVSDIDVHFPPRSQEHPPRRYLVFSSVGDSSDFVAHWVGQPQQQSYDIWICYYGVNVSQYSVYSAFADRIERREGSKFQNFYYIYKKYDSIVLQYERFFVVDDDIIISSSDIDRLFSISHSFDLWISQPSFSKKSKTSHYITTHHKSTFLRYTNFVEINTPVFSRAALKKCMDVYDDSLIGWGIDYLCIWMNGKEEKSRYAIIDAVQCENPKESKKRNGTRELQNVKGFNNLHDRWKNYAIPRKMYLDGDR